MKHVKIMNLPDCDKLIYGDGMIARQIGAMFVVDDEHPMMAESYPIISGGQRCADGTLLSEVCTESSLVCHVGKRITPRRFAAFVKLGMHEEVPASAWDLYHNLRENGGDLQLPISANNKETIREYHIELEFHDFTEDACCSSTDTSDFFFEVYFERGDKDDVFNQLNVQLMDYMNILDTEELGCKLIFRTVDLDYQDVVDRLNRLEIDTVYCDMYNPRC